MSELDRPLPDVHALPPTLDLLEARVLGCLIEKEATTPDVYPLSLNALVNACNQKNNRAPVMALGEPEVEGALDRLRAKRLVTAFSGANARAIKYRHRFSERFPVEPLAQAMLAELMLRGAQTTAGLRGNCERMVAVPDLAECEACLTHLAERVEPLARKLPRQTRSERSALGATAHRRTDGRGSCGRRCRWRQRCRARAAQGFCRTDAAARGRGAHGDVGNGSCVVKSRVSPVARSLGREQLSRRKTGPGALVRRATLGAGASLISMPDWKRRLRF
jgi:uncharacterized protein YceH (UPF0502 family)